MSQRTCRKMFSLSVPVLLCAFAFMSAGVVTAAAAEKKGIKKDDARKLIAALSILELNKAAVTIKEISPPGAVVNVLASVKLGFRFVRDETGAWRVLEVRTGDRQWESFELLARALGSENVSPLSAELEAFATELDALGETKRKAANDGENKTAPDNESEPPKELKRGALSVKNPADAFAPLGSSAVVELEVETSVDFVRDARQRWQVTRIGRPGGVGPGFAAFDAFERALNTEKIGRARADLETLAVALEAYRRARGFYVVATSGTALVDNLNPRYTAAFIRFDPWHRPYEYEGTRERFTLRSLGADGKANTPDDVVKRDEGAGRRDEGGGMRDESGEAFKRVKAFIHPSSLIPPPFLLDALSARLLGSNSGLFEEGQADRKSHAPRRSCRSRSLNNALCGRRLTDTTLTIKEFSFC